jgi:hypothetical protein
MHYADEIRRQAEAAPCAALPEVAKALWAAFGEGRISEAEAEALSVLIEARRTSGTGHSWGQGPNPTGTRDGTAELAGHDRVGSSRTAAVQLGRLRSIFPARRLQRAPERSVAVERRRRLAASGPMPPALAARFTTGQLSVLKIVGDEVARNGACGLCLDAIAARAGVCRRLTQAAIRLAESDGLLLVQERRREGRKNDPNEIRVLSREWQAWLQRGRRSTAPAGAGGIGCKSVRPTDTKVLNLSESGAARPSRGRSADPNPPPRAPSQTASA